MGVVPVDVVGRWLAEEEGDLGEGVEWAMGQGGAYKTVRVRGDYRVRQLGAGGWLGQAGVVVGDVVGEEGRWSKEGVGGNQVGKVVEEMGRKGGGEGGR